MRVFLIVGTHFEGLLENGDDVCAICGADKVKRAADFFNEFVPARRDLLVHINFVGDHDARNMRAVTAHLLVPVLKIRVGDLSLRVEHQDAHVCTEVISRVQFIERLLSRRIPDINLEFFPFHGVLVAIHGERMRRRGALLVVVQ